MSASANSLVELTADFWIGKATRPNRVLLSPDEVAAFNRESMASDPFLVDLSTYPARIERAEVERFIHSMSRRPEDTYHDDEGRRLKKKDYARYSELLALDQLPAVVETRYALVLDRADMRSWPTEDRAFKASGDPGLDRFQENGLFPADMVVVLHESADGQWCFARSYNYAAWVQKERLVFGDRETIVRYRKSPEFLVVTGSRTFAQLAGASEMIEVEMGVRLPLADGGTSRHYHVLLPVRDPGGSLDFEIASVRRDKAVRKGYLPYTRANILRQAYKFLGEHYGWGHSKNARDCTGLVSEVFKTMGILLPRNSWQQGQSEVGHNTRFDENTGEAEKIAAVLAAAPGDLLYSKGHVMIYLGTLGGEPYVIHDTAGAGRVDADGTYHESEFTGVSVTPLVSLHNAPDTSYLDEMYAIKQIR